MTDFNLTHLSYPRQKLPNRDRFKITTTIETLLENNAVIKSARCILLLALLVSTSTLLAEDKRAGHQSLFDGKTLKGWDGNPDFWSVRDGAITGQTTKDNPTKGNTFLIWREGTLGDFQLDLKFRIVGGNSGIQYRSKDLGDWVVGGYQADIDAGMKFIGILYEERGRGILALRSNKVVIGEDGEKKTVGTTGDDKEILAAIAREKWNNYTIIAQGNHLVQKINGKTTIDVVDHQTSKRAMKGILALQLHAGPPMLVQFKDIKLSKPPAAKTGE